MSNIYHAIAYTDYRKHEQHYRKHRRRHAEKLEATNGIVPSEKHNADGRRPPTWRARTRTAW